MSGSAEGTGPGPVPDPRAGAGPGGTDSTEEAATAELYRGFAELEARDVSPVFYGWAHGVAGDREVLGLISALPRHKRQPNLVFAAARFLGAPNGAYQGFRSWLLTHWGSTEAAIHTHSTQTNEAARCAVLLPALSRLDGPLALIEAGASAGLCLYPDRYSYRYLTEAGTTVLDPAAGPSAVELPCRIDQASVPARLPEIAFRAGADLSPIDAGDPVQLKWLDSLIWPEHDARRARLQAAARIATAGPPNLLKGDLLDAVPQLVEAAPEGTTVVVFHSAVLAYLEPARRREFVDLMQSLPGVVWISNEGERVLPEVAAQVRAPVRGRMIVAVDGRPVALAGPHGQSYEALGGDG